MGIFSEEPLLTVLRPAEREALLRRGVPCGYRPGDLLMRQGEQKNYVVAITAGWTNVGSTSDGGRAVIFGLCGPGDLVGELAAIDGGSRSATVTALTEVSAHRLSNAAFLDYLEHNPGFYRALLRNTTLRLRAADSQNEALATMPVLRRLARLLLDLNEPHSRSSSVPRLAQHELAAAIGATRESVAKALADLRARELLGMQGQQIVVLNRVALEAIAAL